MGVVVSAAMVWPMTLDPWDDSFPLSTFPMFASKRDEVWVHIAVGIDEDGELHRIPPSMVGTDEVMQAAQTIRKAIKGGKKRRKELCREIAAAAVSDPRALERIELRSIKYKAVDYFGANPPEPLKLRVRAKCSVGETT